MKKMTKPGFLTAAVFLLALVAGNALATVEPTDAVVIERVFDDSFASILTIDNNYPTLISIDDECYGPLGWANLHVWRFGDSLAQEFANEDGFIVSAEITLSGTGDGEAGLNLSPWWSPNVDGRFNVRTPDGEVACFGGRLPFYSFTASHGVTYQKGSTVRLSMIYTTNPDMGESSPATIEYIYEDGGMYTSGPLPFDEGNPAEADPHGLWGILTPSYVGGYMQFNNMSGFAEGDNFHVEWTDITFEDLGTVVSTEDETWDNVKAMYR